MLSKTSKFWSPISWNNACERKGGPPLLFFYTIGGADLSLRMARFNLIMIDIMPVDLWSSHHSTLQKIQILIIKT